jgi:transcription-repair coupling factor (superfamily II helicase)
MLDNRKKVSDESKKKLEVMQNLDSLGIGFSVASHDMDIRGSGNLLGDEQSGHVKETGVELYQQMLLETIEELKNKHLDFAAKAAALDDLNNVGSRAKRSAVEGLANDNLGTREHDYDFHVQIKLGISLLIPENYIQDLGLRMSFYKKIAAIKNDEDQQNLENEMTDRFGKIPAEILNLMEIAKLKSSCKKTGVEKIEAASDGILISFKDNKFAAPEALLKMVFESKNQIKIISGQKILFVCDVKNENLKIAAANQVIQKLQQLLKQNA